MSIRFRIGSFYSCSICFVLSSLCPLPCFSGKQKGGVHGGSNIFMQTILVGQLHLLSSSVTMLAVPSPSLTATLARKYFLFFIYIHEFYLSGFPVVSLTSHNAIDFKM